MGSSLELISVPWPGRHHPPPVPVKALPTQAVGGVACSSRPGIELVARAQCGTCSYQWFPRPPRKTQYFHCDCSVQVDFSKVYQVEKNWEMENRNGLKSQEKSSMRGVEDAPPYMPRRLRAHAAVRGHVCCVIRSSVAKCKILVAENKPLCYVHRLCGPGVWTGSGGTACLGPQCLDPQLGASRHLYQKLGGLASLRALGPHPDASASCSWPRR